MPTPDDQPWPVIAVRPCDNRELTLPDLDAAGARWVETGSGYPARVVDACPVCGEAHVYLMRPIGSDANKEEG